jgi:hypothetical protein
VLQLGLFDAVRHATQADDQFFPFLLSGENGVLVLRIVADQLDSTRR